MIIVPNFAMSISRHGLQQLKFWSKITRPQGRSCCACCWVGAVWCFRGTKGLC